MTEKKKRPGLFAAYGLDLLGHPRALAAGEAMLTWFWAGLHSRKYELDGFISDEAIENLPKPANSPAWAKKLSSERVGLFERREGGYQILRYEEWNETKEEISRRREGTKERMRKLRDGSGDAAVTPNVTRNIDQTEAVTVGGTHGARAPDVPVSVSVISESGDPEGMQGEAPVVADERPSGVVPTRPPTPGSAPPARPAGARPVDMMAAGSQAAAWARGVAEVTGGADVRPGGKPLVDFAEVVARNARMFPEGHDWEAEGRAFATYAQAAGEKLEIWSWTRWVAANRRSPAATRHMASPVAVAPPYQRPAKLPREEARTSRAESQRLLEEGISRLGRASGEPHA